MATMNEENLFSEFEDLEATGDNKDDMVDDDDDYLPPRKLASEMNHNELMAQLKDRGAPIKGFEDEDAETLQKLLDAEYEEELEQKRIERKEARALAAKQAGLQKRRLLMETLIQEEVIEIEKDNRIEFWLELIKNNTSPSTARINLNAITARSLAKAIFTTSSIVALDVSRMNLTDKAGAYLCRALRNNRSIVKLDLESNSFGPMTCTTLSDSLLKNDVVKHVNLESNPLVKGELDHDVSGVQAMANMFSHNKTLVYLNLWRCNIQSEGGQILVNGLQDNSTIIFFELGNNGLGQNQQKKLGELLERNQNNYEKEQDDKLEAQRIQAEKDAIIKAEQDEIAKKVELEQWMNNQKLLRAANRRREMEEAAAKERAEAEQRRIEEEEARKKTAEEEAAKAAKKAKKKKKKGDMKEKVKTLIEVEELTNMKRRDISELKSFKKVQPIAAEVTRAIVTLIIGPNAVTKTWEDTRSYLDGSFLKAVKSISLDDVPLKKAKELRKLLKRSSKESMRKISIILGVFFEVLKNVYEAKTGEKLVETVAGVEEGVRTRGDGEALTVVVEEGGADEKAAELREEDPLVSEIIQVYRCNPRLMKKLPPKYFLSIPIAGVKVEHGVTAKELMVR
mmetsp:Transcript_10994/g.22559  ORF Transcript_10994/g.22559 Transcript_10994/m.22559 type:complete len:623 (+) Transcript_10994:178-2046(+)